MILIASVGILRTFVRKPKQKTQRFIDVVGGRKRIAQLGSNFQRAERFEKSPHTCPGHPCFRARFPEYRRGRSTSAAFARGALFREMPPVG